MKAREGGRPLCAASGAVAGMVLGAVSLGAQVQNFGLPPSEIERRLAEEPLEVVALQDNRWEGDRTQRAAVRFSDGTTLRVKWARAAHGGFAINNQPRYEVAAYQLQKLFLVESEWVVPPTVLRAMPLEQYRQLDPQLQPTFEETRSVVVAIQYWVSDVGILERPDPDRLEADDEYARRFGHLNLLTYLIRHADANPGNVLVSTTGAPRMFAVDNGVAFRSPDSPRGTVWDRLHTRRLPREAMDRVRGLRRDALDAALAVVAQFRVTPDGLLVSTDRAGSLDDRQGVRRAGDVVQFGLTALELDELWARRDSLIRRLDAGDLATF